MRKLGLLLALLALPLFSAAQPPTSLTNSFSSLIAPATPAVTTVKGAVGVVTHISCHNIMATPVYVKFFDNPGSITLGTTSANYQFMCPGATTGVVTTFQFTWIMVFNNSIKYAVTGALPLNDNTAITAASVIVNVGYN
jgi:hypothetical protein